MSQNYVYNDGGRRAAGFKGETEDCVTRAIAIATKKPYQEVYDALWAGNRDYTSTRRGRVARKIARGRGLSGGASSQPSWFRPGGFYFASSSGGRGR